MSKIIRSTTLVRSINCGRVLAAFRVSEYESGAKFLIYNSFQSYVLDAITKLL